MEKSSNCGNVESQGGSNRIVGNSIKPETDQSPNEKCAEKSDDHGEHFDARVDEQGEIEAAEKVINALFYYRRHVFMRLKRQANAVKLMCEADRALLYPSFPRHIEKVRKCADENQKVFTAIANCGYHMLENSDTIQEAFNITQMRPATEHYMAKVRSTLKQIVRDWSVEGIAERNSCYGSVLEAAEKCFPDKDERHNVKCLVAGAGLARLGWELLQRGFSVTGNEFSIFMLLTSNFILNTCEQVNEFTVYPYILDVSNSWSYEDQLKPVKFPDVNPSTTNKERKNTFSMIAGDFIQAFPSEKAQFDCIVTVFFLDTAANPIDYIRKIYTILKPGGKWINFGPLTYHYDDSDDCVSLELPFAEIQRILPRVGFRVDELRGRGENPPAQYASNQDSMLQYNYYCSFFQCTKL